MTQATAFSQTKTWRFYTSIMLLAPFLYTIKYARVNYGFSEDICVYAIASYFVMTAIYMASGWIARADLMYKYFLRSAVSIE